jgi:hypothetical protein
VLQDQRPGILECSFFEHTTDKRWLLLKMIAPQ